MFKVINIRVGFVFKMEVEREVPEQSQNILSLMKESKVYWSVKKEIMGLLLKKRNGSQLPTLDDMFKVLRMSSNEEKLNGIINNCLQKSTRRLPIQKDPSSDLEPYRIRWSQSVVKEFNMMAAKISREEQYDEEDESVTYVYDCSSLLEFLCSIKPRINVTVRDSSIFLFQFEVVKVSKYSQIRQKYGYLNHGDNILGGDMDNDLRDREKRARKIIEGETLSGDIETFLCMGCTNGDRVSVYRCYFQCFYQYTGKRVEFSLYERIWKSMIRSDSKEILRNPVYFIFKEAVLKVYETFICDKQLGQMVKIRQGSPIDIKLDKFAPIHGNLPCKSFATYIAPFCYTSTSTEQIYQLFRQVYANYFVLLNTVSSLPDSILSLCVLFEEMLWSSEKKMVAKFEELRVQPLRIVFPWMFYCFIGYISLDQFFLLLDRIIGSKSLQIIPLYCISLLFKEKTAILEAKSQSQIEQILEESMYDDIFVDTIREYFKYHL